MKPIVGLVDCNNFYVSCERVFNPALEGKPVVVLSNNDGCIIARSNEAKALGIKMGEPAFKVEKFLEKHNVRVFSSNYSLYADMSQRVMETLALFTPDIEVYSIDEAFLSLERMPIRSFPHFAGHIQTTVKKWTGIPVTVGIAPTKTLAKIANETAKKNPAYKGVLNLIDHPDIDRILGAIDVSDVWGVGRQYTKFLRRHGICTALDLKNASCDWIKKYMTIVGVRTVLELRGISCIEFEDAPPPKKGICASRSFGKKIDSPADLKEALASYVARAAEKLRAQRSVASCLQVYLTTSPFREDAQYYNVATTFLPVATSYTPELIRYAFRMLEKIYKPGYKYHKIAVMLTEIKPQDCLQRDMFVAEEGGGNRQRLMETVDTVNARWGRDTLSYAAGGVQQSWKMRRAKLTPRFTTQWHELPVVRASV